MDAANSTQLTDQRSATADDLLDPERAAALIGCSVGHLTKIRATGEGPDFHRLFRRKGIRYSRIDIERWKASRRFGSTTEYPESLP